MKVSKTQGIKLTKRVSNSRKTQTTELARQWNPFRILLHPLLQNNEKLKEDPFGIFFRAIVGHFFLNGKAPTKNSHCYGRAFFP